MATSNRRPREETKTVTHEGGAGWNPGTFDELELTAASTYLGEDTFYEKADKREKRLVDLVHAATKRDPERTAYLIAKVRSEYKIRTASVLLAVEYVRAGGPDGRKVIDSVIQRPDEPAEVLAYWQSRYGRSWPWAVRRGVADGLVRTLTERNYLKYVGQGRKLVTIADAIELTHPSPRAPWQSELFKYALDEAHHGDGEPGNLGVIGTSRKLGQVPENERRLWVRDTPGVLAEAGYTWERLSGWLPGGMDAEAWEAVIPTMGVMALLRNLRNFDEAGISPQTQSLVEQKITMAEEVWKSRILPYRTLQAYTAAPSDRWKHALNITLDLAAGNAPTWHRTLFLIDVSGSMGAYMSGKSKARMVDVAATMAGAAMKGSKDSQLVLFGGDSAELEIPTATSPLNVAAAVGQIQARGHLGYSTYGWTAIQRFYDATKHDRAVVFTDGQMHDGDYGLQAPVVFFNLAGYSTVPAFGRNRIHLGGMSDAAFRAAHELTGSEF